MVYRTVVTVFDTTQFAVTFTGADVTADGTLLADARRKLHIPFTVVTLGVRFVGKYAGRANFDQVTGKFAFQRAVFRATEVDDLYRQRNLCSNAHSGSRRCSGSFRER